MKRFFCDDNSPLGKVVRWVETAFVSVLIPVKIDDEDWEIPCPCCMFWRGVLGGALLGGAVVGMVWAVFS